MQMQVQFPRSSFPNPHALPFPAAWPSPPPSVSPVSPSVSSTSISESASRSPALSHASSQADEKDLEQEQDPAPSPHAHISAQGLGQARSSAPRHPQTQGHARKLGKGDTVYWHHLKRSGEIPGVEDDRRARVGLRGGGSEEAQEQEREQEDYLVFVVGGR